MRYNDYGSPSGDARHILLDDALAFIVEGACRLIENQNAGVGHERARDGDALALAARKGRAALADDRIVAFGKLQNEVVGAGELRGADDCVHGGRGVGERDIIAHRAVEEDVFLKHDRGLPPEPSGVSKRQVHAIDENAAAFWHVEPLDQFGERALS